MKIRVALIATLTALAACRDVPTQAPIAALSPASAAHSVQSQVYTSDGTETAWGPIYQNEGSSWSTTACTSAPQVALNDPRWGPGHAASAFGTNAHPWQGGAAANGFSASWINAWGNISSNGGPGYVYASNPGAHNWTKYETQVSGNGSFVLRLLADNCSWIYLDGALVGRQGDPWDYNHLAYGVTLNGTHTLTFIIFDGGGLAGGMYRLETTTTPPPPLDATPPVISHTVTGTKGNNGWYTSDVNVSWSVVDNETPIANSTGCGAATVTQDTDGTTFTCAATSGGGTATASVTVKRDAAAPEIAFSGNAGSYTVDQTVAITCQATDATSGIASSTCPSASGAAYDFVGTNTLSATATDNAGNGGAASASFTVNVTGAGLCALVQRWVSSAGVANSMCVKIDHASWGALRNEVSAQSGKKISAANAAILLRLVNLMS